MSRVLIAGDYDRHQCGITIPEAQVQDTGVWQCEVRIYWMIMMMLIADDLQMEEYQFTDLVAGDRHRHTFEVNVDERQTTLVHFTPQDTTMKITAEDTITDSTDGGDTTTDITDDWESIKINQGVDNKNDQEATTYGYSETQTYQLLPLEQGKSQQQVKNFIIK